MKLSNRNYNDAVELAVAKETAGVQPTATFSSLSDDRPSFSCTASLSQNNLLVKTAATVCDAIMKEISRNKFNAVVISYCLRLAKF